MAGGSLGLTSSRPAATVRDAGSDLPTDQDQPPPNESKVRESRLADTADGHEPVFNSIGQTHMPPDRNSRFLTRIPGRSNGDDAPISRGLLHCQDKGCRLPPRNIIPRFDRIRRGHVKLGGQVVIVRLPTATLVKQTRQHSHCVPLPDSCTATNNCPNVYSITLSARRTSPAGISWPIALAARRLSTNSNLVGCSTGSSPGLIPRSTWMSSRAN